MFQITNIQNPWDKKSVLDKRDGTNECALGLLRILFVIQDGYEKNQTAFLSSEKVEAEPNHSYAARLLSHVLFPKDLESIDIELLGFKEQIEKGYTVVPALLANTLRALNNANDNLEQHIQRVASRSYNLVP